MATTSSEHHTPVTPLTNRAMARELAAMRARIHAIYLIVHALLLLAVAASVLGLALWLMAR